MCVHANDSSKDLPVIARGLVVVPALGCPNFQLCEGRTVVLYLAHVIVKETLSWFNSVVFVIVLTIVVVNPPRRTCWGW